MSSESSEARSFKLSEDWLAVVIGLGVGAGIGVGINDREGVAAGVSYTRSYTFMRTKGGAKPVMVAEAIGRRIAEPASATAR
mgnify:CR=1 FL=1